MLSKNICNIMLISEHILKFLEHAEVGKHQSGKTIENYHHYLKRFSEFVGKIKPEDIDLDLIHEYRLYLNRYKDRYGSKLSVKTQNYHVIALRAFLKYLIKNDIKTLAPEKVDLSKIEERTVEYLNRDELERLMNSLRENTKQGLRNRAIVETLYSTGLRVSELTSLNRSNIDLERREFMVRGKGRKTRIVFLSERSAEYIRKYLITRKDEFEPLFINYGRARSKDMGKSESRRLTPNSVQEMIRNVGLRAGIIKKVTPHTIRHSFATELLLNGADIRSVQDLLGHASITTTQIYTHITDKKLREVHEKYHK